MAKQTAETPEQIAAKQEAISRAYGRFVDEYEDAIPYDPPPEARDDGSNTEYPTWHLIVSANPEQLAAYDKMVAEELARVAGG